MQKARGRYGEGVWKACGRHAEGTQTHPSDPPFRPTHQNSSSKSILFFGGLFVSYHVSHCKDVWKTSGRCWANLLCLIVFFVAKTTGWCLEDVEQLFCVLSGSSSRRPPEDVRKTSSKCFVSYRVLCCGDLRKKFGGLPKDFCPLWILCLLLTKVYSRRSFFRFWKKKQSFNFDKYAPACYNQSTLSFDDFNKRSKILHGTP